MTVKFLLLIPLLLLLTACAAPHVQPVYAPLEYQPPQLEYEPEPYIPYEPEPPEPEPYVPYIPEPYIPYEPEPEPFETIFIAEPLPYHIIEQITDVSFHPNPHFDYCHLAYLTITHVDFYGYSRHGHIIVAASIADEVLDIFREIYDYGFPIAGMRLIDYYDALDYYSMADNNSVGFNYRYIAGTTTLSRHAWGMAIDINPIQNPFIRGDVILPVAGRYYLDRSYVRPGMIVPGDVVYRAFTSRGWIWGGHWRVPIDYHHFERR